MMNRSLRLPVLAFFFACLAIGAEAQSVAINNTGAAPNANAMLDITVNNKGLLIPRMTAAQRLAIPAPADGLWVFQTDNAGANTSGLYYYDTTPAAWVRLATGDGWKIAGDASTAANYVGTSDAADFVMGSNGNPAVYMTTAGNVGIGTAAPVEKLEVDGGIHFDPTGATNNTNTAGVIRYNTTDQRHEGNITGTAAGWTKMENAFTEVLGANYQGTTLTCGPGNTATSVGSAQSSGNADTPFPTAVGRGSKVQYIFRANELINFGLCAGPITEVAFRVITDDTQASSYNIFVRIANRSLPTPQFTTQWDVAARTSGVRGQILGLVASSGWFAIGLTNPFVWNGVSDIVLDVSYLRSTVAGNSPPVLLTANTGFT
jgi:hypothetical protein